MASRSASRSLRRVGMSKSDHPPPLLRNIRGNETKALPAKKSKLKVPPAIDAPPLHSSEDENNDDAALSSQPRNTESQDAEAPREEWLADSSGESDRGRAAHSNIRRTTFASSSVADKPTDSQKGASNRSAQSAGKPKPGSYVGTARPSKRHAGSHDVEPYMGTARPSATASSSKRRKLDDAASGDSSHAPSSMPREDSISEPSSSGAYLKDEHGFIKKGKGRKATTYGSQKVRQSKAPHDAPLKSKIQVPDDVKSPSPVKAKNNTLRIPSSNSLISPLKERMTFKDPGDNEVPKPPALKPTVKRTHSSSSSIRNKFGQAKSQKKKAKEKEEQARKSPDLPRAVFKMPEELPDPDRERPHVDGAVVFSLSDLDSSGDEAGTVRVPTKEKEVESTETLCPWCGVPVDEKLLKEFAQGKRMNVRMQTKFCQKHKKMTAIESWQARGYPEVDWDNLESRFADHDELLLGIVNGETSHFRTILADKIESGKARSLKKEDNMNPGYYGPRGFNLMCDYLVSKFADLLKKRAVDDRVISGRGSAAFIQSVLVAELAVQLVMADMDVPVDEARDIVEESKALGEMVHEEV